MSCELIGTWVLCVSSRHIPCYRHWYRSAFVFPDYSSAPVCIATTLFLDDVCISIDIAMVSAVWLGSAPSMCCAEFETEHKHIINTHRISSFEEHGQEQGTGFWEVHCLFPLNHWVHPQYEKSSYSMLLGRFPRLSRDLLALCACFTGPFIGGHCKDTITSITLCCCTAHLPVVPSINYVPSRTQTN